MAGEILTGGHHMGFAHYGPLWRKLRRAAHEGLSIRASENYQPLQEREAAVLVLSLLMDPQDWDSHIRRSAASALLSVVYDWPPLERKDDPVVRRVNDFMERLVKAANPGVFLVDIFPFMLLLPDWMARWKREGKEWHKKDTEVFEGFVSRARDVVLEGTREYHPSFSTTIFKNNERIGLTDKEAGWLSGTMFGAGAETSAASSEYFMLAMALYPEVMRKAQAEIDSVVGRDRMPTFADRHHLPYVEALVKEVLRWRPVTPLGGPRCTMQADWYDSYYIPKGSLVIPNVWALNRDPSLFPDFDEFRPERFLDAKGETVPLLTETHGQGHVTFGFGRRMCVGMHVANHTLFIFMASILWALDIDKAVDEQGNVIVPSRTKSVDEGLVVRPGHFECRITPRSPDVAAIVELTKTRAM